MTAEDLLALMLGGRVRMDLWELENVIVGEEILFSWLELWLELSKGLGSERKETVFGKVTEQCSFS